MKPWFTVLVVADKSGKTQLIDRLKRVLPGRLQLLGENESPYWDGYDVVAFDGLRRGGDVASRVEYMEHEALQRGKKLILMVRDANDISQRGICLQSSPLVIEIEGDRLTKFGFSGLGFLSSRPGMAAMQGLVRFAARLLRPTDFTAMLFRECLNHPWNPT